MTLEQALAKLEEIKERLASRGRGGLTLRIYQGLGGTWSVSEEWTW